jgi:hypothetical protein
MDTRDMACHTWAMSGNPLAGAVVNRAFESLMNMVGTPYVTGAAAAPANAGALAALRLAHMQQIALLCEQRTQLVDHEVYLCGGFGRNDIDVCPEHMWLEDHSTNRSYDTFIDQPVRRVDRVGVPGQPFQPGCEAVPFPADRIVRVRLDGYTATQVASLP